LHQIDSNPNTDQAISEKPELSTAKVGFVFQQTVILAAIILIPVITGYDTALSDGPFRGLILMGLPLFLYLRKSIASSGTPLMILASFFLCLTLFSGNCSSITLGFTIFLFTVAASRIDHDNGLLIWSAPLIPLFALTFPYPLFFVFTDAIRTLSIHTSKVLLMFLKPAAISAGSILHFPILGFEPAIKDFCLVSNDITIYVARACGGGNSLLMLIALSLGLMTLRPVKPIRGFFTLFFAIPIVIICNAVRIAGIFVLAHHIGTTRAIALFHSSGWIFFCIELLLWLVIILPRNSSGPIPDNSTNFSQSCEKPSDFWKGIAILMILSALSGQCIRLLNPMNSDELLNTLKPQLQNGIKKGVFDYFLSGTAIPGHLGSGYPSEWWHWESEVAKRTVSKNSTSDAINTQYHIVLKHSWKFQRLVSENRKSDFWMCYTYFSSGKSFSSYWAAWLWETLRGFSGLQGRMAILKFYSHNPGKGAEWLENTGKKHTEGKNTAIKSSVAQNLIEWTHN
jgi:exosortase/archaeosortase family protein